MDDGHSEAFEFDWAICELDRNIDGRLEYFDIMVTPTDIKDEYIEILGYLESTETMYWSRGKITDISKRRVFYNARTDNGISGSPIFFNNGNYTVFGIHTSDAPGGTKINSLIYNLVEFLNE